MSCSTKPSTSWSRASGRSSPTRGAVLRRGAYCGWLRRAAVRGGSLAGAVVGVRTHPIRGSRTPAAALFCVGVGSRPGVIRGPAGFCAQAWLEPPRGGSFVQFRPRGGSFVRFWPGFSHESATSARGTLRIATSAWGTHGIATSAPGTLRIATSRAPAPPDAGRPYRGLPARATHGDRHATAGKISGLRRPRGPAGLHAGRACGEMGRVPQHCFLKKVAYP